MSHQSTGVMLRPVVPEDLPIIFEHERDPVAIQMAAFAPPDPDDRQAFEAHWAKMLGSPEIIVRTVLLDGRVVGHVACFPMDGNVDVTYWIDRACWGQGVATRALQAFLEEVDIRPLRGRVVTDNVGSRRVLEKCGFEVVGKDRGFAHGRGCEVDELVLSLV